MQQLDGAVKSARDCHTKLAWEALFSEYGEALASSTNSKPLADLFKMLKHDSQSLQYDPVIWAYLLKGCLSSWNLELGQEIAEYIEKIPSAELAVPSARIFLQKGVPAKARAIANRALRLSKIDTAEKLRLELLLASSYSWEGKNPKALKILSGVTKSVKTEDLPDQDRADFFEDMGRMQFYLGQYEKAGQLFYEASKIFRALGDWDSATKAIYNTAGSFDNLGTEKKDVAMQLIEETRRLAELHSLKGPLAHCEAFYGLDAFNHGNFAAAKEHLRRAMDYLPISDKSVRRLHIISMLALTYLAMGRYHLAKKFGRKCLDLATLDESIVFKTRFICLEAELDWEEGEIDKSNKALHNALLEYEQRPIHTLEELSMLARYNLQVSLLGKPHALPKVKIDANIRKNEFIELDHRYSVGELFLNQGNYKEAEKEFTLCLDRGREIGDRTHEALGLLGSIQSKLRQRKPREISQLLREFEVVLGRIGDTPLKTHIQFIHAAQAYQLGEFNITERVLRVAARNGKQSFADKFVLNSAIATVEGRSSKFTSEWQAQLMGRFTRTYFAPTLEALDDRIFKVGPYSISLERHPSLAEMLHFLLMKNNFSASPADIQAKVWQQSLESQGWQQKIRNTIMRLRDFFPYTIAPLIIHTDEIRLFSEAIEIKPVRGEGAKADDEIKRLIADSPMSSSQLATRLNISPATAKRILKRLQDKQEIFPKREGRNIFYQING